MTIQQAEKRCWVSWATYVKREKQPPRGGPRWILREANLSGARVPKLELGHCMVKTGSLCPPPRGSDAKGIKNPEEPFFFFLNHVLATMLACSSFMDAGQRHKAGSYATLLLTAPGMSRLSAPRPDQGKGGQIIPVHMVGWGNKKGTWSLGIVSSVMGSQRA